MSKPKCTKHTILRPFLEVEMSKKCTPLWREAHSKSKMLKTDGPRPLLEVELSKKCTPLWREAHFQVKMYKTHQVRFSYRKSARRCGAKHIVQNTPRSDHFWKLSCRKSARHCGAKHISKSKCTKHTPLLEVELSKMCTPLWREAHFQVKMYKTRHSRSTFGS